MDPGRENARVADNLHCQTKFIETVLEKKNNTKCTLPSLKRVEWNFIKEMDAVWNQMVIDYDLQEQIPTPLPNDDQEL